MRGKKEDRKQKQYVLICTAKIYSTKIEFIKQWSIISSENVNAKRAMIVNEMTIPWNKKEQRKVDDTKMFQGQTQSQTVARSHPFERNSRFLPVWRPRARSLARIVLRGPAPLPLVASLWVAPAFCVASLYNIYSPPPNSFRAVLFRWLEEKAVGAVCLPSPGPDGSIGPSNRLCSIFSSLVWVVARGKEGNRRAERKRTKNKRKRMKEEERDRLRGEGETKGAYASSICWAPRRSPDRGLSYKRPMGAPQSDTWKPKSRKLSLI